MTLPVNHVVNTIISDKWFQMLLTLVVIIGYVVSSIVGTNPDTTNTLGSFSLIAFGYWFGQMGSGVTLAQRVESATIQKVVSNGE